MNKKLTKRQVRANETKERLYKAALELLERDGYENIRIEDICQVAEVSIGSFYNYFKSKNEILEVIFKQADDYFVKEIANRISTESPKEALAEFFRLYADYNQKTGLITIKQLYNPDNQFFTKKRGMQEVLDEIIRKGQNAGSITDRFSSSELVNLLFMVARGVVYDWCIRNAHYDLTEKMNLVMGLYLKSFMI